VTKNASRGLQQALVFIAVIAAAATWYSSVRAATMTVTFPSVLAAGPDYATDVLKDAWDFSNASDIGLDTGETINWSSFAVSGGFAGGTAANGDAQMSMLFTGFYTVNNPGKNGLRLPINTSIYKKLSFRMNSNVALQTPQVHWFHTTWLDPADAAVAPDFDRNLGTHTLDLERTVVGLKVYQIDLSLNSASGSEWTDGNALGLRIDPNNSAAGNYSFDWVRLTRADSDPVAAKQNISWTGGTGATTIEVRDSANANTILTVTTTSAAATSFNNWNYGVLPPGDYTLRLTRTDGSTISQAFKINTPPLVTVTTPSRTSGQDYATTVLQNAWDMSSASDVVTIGSENITPNPPDFASQPGKLTATNTNSDPNITLLHTFNNGGGAKAIDTSKYRYFTYCMEIDGGLDIGNGSVARIHWGSGSLPNTFSTTKDIIVFPGLNCYTLDMANLDAEAPSGGLEPAIPAISREMVSWTAVNKTQFRFDPHEFGTNPGDPTPQRTFHIDDMKLTAKPSSNGTYLINFTKSDPDAGATTTVNLYRDTDTDPTSGRVAIASGLTGTSFSWNTSALTAGQEYFIYAEISDGVQTTGSYSDAPVVIAAPCAFSINPTSATVHNNGGSGSVALTTGASCDWTATSNSSFITITSAGGGTGSATINYTAAGNAARTQRTGTLTIGGQTFTLTQKALPTRGDFNADGIADLAAFATGTGLWKLRNIGNTSFGLAGDIPVPGDYNGDSTLDIAVYRPSTGDWFINGQGQFNWGRSGDVPVPGDYDGNGTTDLAVVRTTEDGSLRWYVNGQFQSFAWGQLGDIPMAADFDGDRKTDFVVFRPATGLWFINMSGSNHTTSAQFQWGAAGDLPVIGDYDGDGRNDLTIYRTATGEWFIAFSSTGFSTRASHLWGAQSDIPVALDLDGDRVDEVVVFRPSTASWFSLNRVTAAQVGIQFGATGDRPALLRPQLPAVSNTDFDGDRKSDVTVFRPGSGTWFTALSNSGFAASQAQQWGGPGDIKVPGDYDGDGRVDYAVFRPSEARWYLRFSSDGGLRAVAWGAPTDLPVMADFDGDGRTDLTVYRPSNGSWFILTSGSGFTAFIQVVFGGATGDKPMPADYDGDGRADLTIYRPSTGQWFINTSSAQFGGVLTKVFGSGADVPVTGDWNGDGRADIAIFRPSTGQWFATDPITNASYPVRTHGGTGDTPLAHDFDGDRVVDSAVFRPSTGFWYIRLTSNGQLLQIQWGSSSDQPLSNAGDDTSNR
jgi:hypothetical protein